MWKPVQGTYLLLCWCRPSRRWDLVWRRYLFFCPGRQRGFIIDLCVSLTTWWAAVWTNCRRVSTPRMHWESGTRCTGKQTHLNHLRDYIKNYKLFLHLKWTLHFLHFVTILNHRRRFSCFYHKRQNFWFYFESFSFFSCCSIITVCRQIPFWSFWKFAKGVWQNG